MRIFVAGASGTIGRRAVRCLLEHGHDVTALAHTPAKVAALERAGARLAYASIFDQAAMRRAVAGHEAVINLATRIPVGSAAVKPGAWREDDRLRAEGSKTLADAALEAGVGRFIQESVTFVYPDAADGWITECTRPAPNLRSQLATTTAATNAILFAGLGGVGVVLRFGQLYGPDPGSAEVLRRARAGKPVVLGTPEGWLSPLHPEDAATAVAAALECESGVFNVTESPVRRGDWAVALGRAAGDDTGRTARFYPALMQRMAGARAEPLTRSHRVSHVAFTYATGWQPSYDALLGGWSGAAAPARLVAVGA